MGSSSTKGSHAHGSLHIETTQVTNMAGYNLQGAVHLDMKNHFNCASLEFEIIGKEKAKWVTTDKNNKQTLQKICGGKNTFFHIRHSIHKFENKIALIGQYSFPFNITLPNWLPQSFMHVGKNESCFKVKYEIRAAMYENCESSKSQIPPIVVRKQIVVIQPTYNQSQNLTFRSEHDLKTMMLFSQGKSAADITFEKDAYHPEEFANATAILDNKACHKAVDKVKIKLFQVMSGYSVDGYRFKDENCITKRSYYGADANSSAERLLSLHLKDIGTQDKYIKEHMKKKNLSQMEKILLTKIPPSVRTDLIRCEYYLKIEFEHSGFTMGSSMRPISNHVYIYAPVIPQGVFVNTLPQHWQPTAARPVQFVVTNQQHAAQYQKYLYMAPQIQMQNPLENPYRQSQVQMSNPPLADQQMQMQQQIRPSLPNPYFQQNAPPQNINQTPQQMMQFPPAQQQPQPQPQMMMPAMNPMGHPQMNQNFPPVYPPLQGNMNQMGYGQPIVFQADVQQNEMIQPSSEQSLAEKQAYFAHQEWERQEYERTKQPVEEKRNESVFDPDQIFVNPQDS